MRSDLINKNLEHDFVHLRVQSSYSMLASALKIEKIVERTKKLKMQAVAMTDYCNLYGMLEFSLEASKKGIQPIHGIIQTIKYEDENDKPKFGNILLLAKDEAGYQNLLKIASLPFIKNDRSLREHISLKDLQENNTGLIVLSGYTEGPIGIELTNGNFSKAKELSEFFQKIFGDRFYFEIMRHNLPLERQIENSYIELANELRIPLVATNNVLFEDIGMHYAHDVLLCIAAGVVKDNPNRKTASNQCYFKSPKEMVSLFEDLPSAIENAGYIAQRCSVKAEVKDPILPNYKYKDYVENDLLRKLSTEGLENKILDIINRSGLDAIAEKQLREKYYSRLEYELSVICNMNFAGYFLIVSDFIKWSKEQGIYVGPGRGSGAGSIVAWCLLITDLDPIDFGLLFERFLNPERVSMPDFDIDFCQERREEVINYVRRKYSDARVGQIITFGKLQAKAVIKDVSRVLSLKYDIADQLTELVPFNAVNPVTLEQAIHEVAELKQAFAGKGLYNHEENHELIKQVLENSLILEGLHRHSSVHAAGVVICGEDLMKLVPICKDVDGDMPIIQYSMKYAELAGLIKFDFLGLQTLTLLSKCTELLKENGIDISLKEINFSNEKTYQMLSNGDSVGVFQFESHGMRDTLKKLKPDCITDLMALGALYRPGPMDNIPTYIACKHKKQEPDFLHPMLKPILEETYGVIVYQEQVLEIAKVLAGYTLGAADLLRRAMGKKIKSEMADQEQLFIEGALLNNITAAQAKEIFASVAKFAGYGFNRAHAASYAVISYYTAYLKANYPVEFLVSCLNLELNNQDKIALFLNEARSLNIKVLPPDVNQSAGFFSIKLDPITNNKQIVYGLGAIKNITTLLGNEIRKEAIARGGFNSLQSFIEAIPPKLISKKSLESLIKSGALNSLYGNIKELFDSRVQILAYVQKHNEEKLLNQFNLFGNSTMIDNIIAKTADFDEVTKAYHQYDVLGLFISYHPLTSYKDFLNKNKIREIRELKNTMKFGGSKLSIAGVILKKDSRMSARGRFVSITVSDDTGLCDITVFSEQVLKNYSHLLNVGKPVIIDCDAFRDEGSIRLTAINFTDLDDFLQKNTNKYFLKAKSTFEAKQIVNYLRSRNNKEFKEVKFELSILTEPPYIIRTSFYINIKITPADNEFLERFHI